MQVTSKPMMQTKAISRSTLRHLGWDELLNHYRRCLRTRIAQERISFDLAALQEGGVEENEVQSEMQRSELSLDPEPREHEGEHGGAKARLAHLRGLEWLLNRESNSSRLEKQNRPRANLLSSLAEIEDLRPSLRKLRGGTSMTLLDLLIVDGLLRVTEVYVTLRGDLVELEARALDGYLWAETSVDSDVFAEAFRLGRALSRSIIWEDGSQDPRLADAASPNLKSLRAQLRQQKQQLMQYADRMVRHETMGEMLQNRYWTEREGRVVLPMRSDALGKLKLDDFVVHGSSATGQTVYVEPKDLVTGNNGFRQAEMLVLVEEQRIIQEFCRSVSDLSTALGHMQQAMLRLDDVAARLDLSNKMNGIEPEVINLDRESKIENEPKPHIDAPGLKHPLMVLRGLDVVPNDICLPVGSALIISGPNAGGKTVALKATGLAILMAKCGLRIPSASMSKLPDYRSIVTDVGDGQSIAANLSTFSAQMMHVKEAWLSAQSLKSNTLVLFDEIAVGTDPEQGAALAEAIVVELLMCGATVMVTTHYDRLKHLANSEEMNLPQPVHNAAVGFDLENMRPTFRLTMGLPGTSSPITVARRLGVSEVILRRAEGNIDGRTREIDRLLLELAAEKDRSHQQKLEIDRASRDLEQRMRALDQREQRMVERSFTKRQESFEEASRELAALSQELKSERKRIRRAGIDPDTVLDSKKILSGPQQQLAHHRKQRDKEQDAIQDEIQEDTRSDVRTSKADLVRSLRVGMKVQLSGFSGEGELLAIKSGRATVRLNNLRTTVPVQDIELPTNDVVKSDSNLGWGHKQSTKQPGSQREGLQQEFRRTKGKSGRQNLESSVLSVSSAQRHFGADPLAVTVGIDNTIDLRGTRVDQASEQLEVGLDQALRRDQDIVVLIHGYGSGDLRKMLRQHLKRLNYVRRFRPGVAAEGADGVTIVWLGGE